MKKIYIKNLDKLIETCAALPNTVFFSKAKILALIILNMKYEVIMKQRDLKRHPYELVAEMIDTSISLLESMCEISFFRQQRGNWQTIWPNGSGA